MSEQRGILLCGHGSRDATAVAQFAHVADLLRKRLSEYHVEHGYLEFARPILREALDALHAHGIHQILAVPAMLMAAAHVKNDIPSVLNTYQAQHTDVSIQFGRELGLDPKILRAAGDRIEQALQAAGDSIPRHDTLLVMVGRGTSDPDANGNITKFMRLLWEGLGFGWGETCFSGVTFPLVEPALERAARLGFKRIVVFPLFLFTGVLVQRIYDTTDASALRHPEIEFVKASYLNDHPLVIEAFAERVREILDGTANMNCQLCKYREHVLGFEGEVGMPQESHHHHVEGIGASHHHHHHDHEHSHRPVYPHADHPLGPKSLSK